MREPEPINWVQGWRESTPWVSLVGTRVDTGEPSVTVPYAEPRCWARPSRPLTRTEHELWQLGQFCQDFYVGTGEWLAAYGAIKGETPDFRLQRRPDGSSPLDVELTAFTPTQRRRDESVVRRLREAISAAPSDFAHLAGCHVSLWISPETTLRQVVSRHQAAILDALRRAEHPPSLLGQHGLPSGFTKLGAGSGWELAGYELVAKDQLEWENLDLPLVTVSSALEMTIPEVARDLASTIRSHDYDGVDWLVVPIVAPDRNGIATFEDEILVHELLRQTEDVGLDVSDVKCQVMLHFWSDGQIVQLTPERTQVCAGRPDHQRKLTAITYNRLGDMFCFPLATPALKLIERG